MNEIHFTWAPPSRRAVLAGVAASLGVLLARKAAAQAQMQEKPSDAAHATLTAIHYEIDFKAAPQRIYTALLDARQFAAFTGMPAEIDSRPGGAFSLFGGMISGRNVEFVENQRIVQAWRPGSWDAGVYSIVHFELKARGSEATLFFDHTGFPAGPYDHLDAGWQGHYWGPMKKYLA
jgi:activator of HSP90 ATPase